MGGGKDGDGWGSVRKWGSVNEAEHMKRPSCIQGRVTRPCLKHLAGDLASSDGMSSVYLSFLPSSSCPELKDKCLRSNDTISISTDQRKDGVHDKRAKPWPSCTRLQQNPCMMNEWNNKATS